MKKRSRSEAQEWRRLGYTILLNDTYSYPRNDVQDYLNAFVQLPDRYNRRGLERQCSKKHGDQRSEIKSNAKYIVLTTQSQYREQQQQQLNDNNTGMSSSVDIDTNDVDIQDKLAFYYESASHDAKVFAHRMGKADEIEVHRLQKQETERQQRFEQYQRKQQSQQIRLRQDQQRNGMETMTRYNGYTASDGEINEQRTSNTNGNLASSSYCTQEDLMDFDYSELVEYILESNGIPSPYVHRMGNPSMLRQRRLSNYSATSVDSFDSLRKWSHHHHQHAPTTVIINNDENQNGYHHHPDIHDENSNPTYAMTLSLDNLDMGSNNHEHDKIFKTTETQATRGGLPLAAPMSQRNIGPTSSMQTKSTIMSNNNERVYNPNPIRIPISRRNSGPATTTTAQSRITFYNHDTGVYDWNPKHVSRRNSGPATTSYNSMNQQTSFNQNYQNQISHNNDQSITLNELYRPIQNLCETNVALPPGSRMKATDTTFHVPSDNSSSTVHVQHLSMMESTGTLNARSVSLSHGLIAKYPNNQQQPFMMIPSSHSHPFHQHYPSSRRNSVSGTVGTTSSGNVRNYYRKNSFNGGGCLPLGSGEEYYAAIA